MKYAKADLCDSGRIEVSPTRGETLWSDIDDDAFFNPHPGAHPFRFGHCTTCDVVTWPWVTRHLDPSHWSLSIRKAKQNLAWWLRGRRDRWSRGRA